MACSSRWAAALAFLTVLALAPYASAQGDDDEARMHFRLGRAYYDSGRFADAAGEFEQAYQLSGRAALLYNLYVSYRDGGQPREAADRLRRYLAEAENVENRSQLEARLASLERMLESRGGDEATEPEPSEAPPDEAPPDEASPDEATGQESTSTAPPPTEPSDGGGGGMWTPGWIIAGGGAALMVAGIVTGVLALDAQTQLREEFGCRDDGACMPGFEDTASNGALLAGLTDGFLIGGGVIAASGVVLALVLSDGGDSDTAVSASCGPDGCMAAVGGSFE
jgi:tetratricopeptide (TPR) repeat protein